MSVTRDMREAQRLGLVVVNTLQREGADPMQAMAALPFALGAMIAAAAEQGITRPGQSGRLLEHLFKIAEAEAENHLSQGRS
jgi:hypothetical protein